MPSPTYISREDLSAFLLQPANLRPSMVIVDVRDDDHVGGHIYTSTHIPSSSLDYKIPELVRKLQGTEMVIFHCALSQQRGPTAARRYMRERSRLLTVDRKDSLEVKDGDDKPLPAQEVTDGDTAPLEQKIYILDGGFVKWQEKYGRDIRLTEAYAPDIWVDYY